MKMIAEKDLYADAKGKLTDDPNKRRWLIARKDQRIKPALIKRFDLEAQLAASDEDKEDKKGGKKAESGAPKNKAESSKKKK